MIKKLILGLALTLSLAIGLQAESYSTTYTGGTGSNVLILGPIKLNSISVSSLSASNGTINFYDSPFLTNIISVAAFTNVSASVSLYTNIYTDIFGKLSTNYYQRKTYTTNTLAAGTRSRKQIASIGTVSNSVTTLDFDGVFLGFGLLATNVAGLGGSPGGGVTITVNYDKQY